MSVAVNAATGAARFESTELGTDPANWGDELEANYGEALDKFRVSHNSSTGIVSIGLMTMKPEHQGEGVGTKILEDLTQAADDTESPCRSHQRNSATPRNRDSRRSINGTASFRTKAETKTSVPKITWSANPTRTL